MAKLSVFVAALWYTILIKSRVWNIIKPQQQQQQIGNILSPFWEQHARVYECICVCLFACRLPVCMYVLKKAGNAKREFSIEKLNGRNREATSKNESKSIKPKKQ